MRNLTMAALAGLVSISSAAHAQTTAFQPMLTELSNDIVYDVKADGTYTKEETENIRLNTDQAVKLLSQVPVRYSKSLQDAEVLEAYTITKDGKRIDVTPDKILEQQSKESAGAPMFDDGRVKTVVFPGTEVGATINLRERKTQRKAIFPRQFSFVEAFNDLIEMKSVTVTIRAPASLKLYVDATGIEGGQVASDKPDVQVWRWSLKDAPAHAPELQSVSMKDHSPRIAVTTFPDFAAVGAAYQQRAQPKSAVTPAVQTLADQLTKGISDPRRQAEALYDWVSTHIRYVAIYLDFGGVVPHDADTILNAAYGDCKDHVTVLQALLAAKGIKSSAVLVNAGNEYWLPNVAAPLGVFDHAITYLPDFNLFVDSTAGVARFGTLPASEMGKSALVTDDGTGTGKIVTLPVDSADNTRVQTTIRVTLDSDGNANGTGEISSTGTLDWISREVFASIQPGVEPQVASRVLTATGQNGTGNFHHSNLRDLTTPFVYKTEFQLPGYAQFPGPGAIQVPVGLNGFSGISSVFESFGPKTRAFAMPFLNRHVTETTIITLPDDVKVARLPQPAKIVSPFGTYTSTYVADGRQITVTRDLNLSMPGVLLQPEQYPELRKMALAVSRDMRSQLVY
ncbi:DUF3857 domain-containing protein [Paraburkholderia metrosideri]|uniref:DUF3857 domain-containing protein n=1 Tax=Paraburkholderia metrosideri TaxID=580937 RepID=A0ABM8NKL3_9BURK|nr:DUF3857 domain-containing protein [Paraburkholderia metrosideri]CAD6530472.1 hypothetical protein LMG28140_02350 [Paraburkholderia metrosideri]